jgi:hypothetical protein
MSGYMFYMQEHMGRHIGDILKERNIGIVGADLATPLGQKIEAWKRWGCPSPA